jgi:hypothetical protein
MPVRRDERGRWRYQKVVRLPDGRRVRVSGTPTLNTKLEAEREEREHIRRAIEGKHAKAVPTLTQFVEGRDGWLQTYPGAVGNRPSSIREKEVHWRFHIKPVLGSKRLDEIKRDTLDAFFSRLRQQGRRGRNKQDGRRLSPKSVKNVRTTLRRMLMSAVEWEIALEWGDIDFANGFVKFTRSSTRGEVGPTKTGRERKIPITPELAAALKGIRHLRSKLVFCNPDGSLSTSYTSGCGRRAGRRGCERCGGTI